MTAALGKSAALQPLVTSVAAFAKRLDDLVFATQSAAWVIALQLYAVLRRMATTDSALATALGPVAEFMAYRRPAPKAPGQPTKRQERSIKKSLKNVKKLAPQLLASTEPQPVGGTSAEAPAGAPAPTPAAPATPHA